MARIFEAHAISYRDTGKFSKIVVDYLDKTPELEAFYDYHPDVAGIKKAVAERRKGTTNRTLLADELMLQYQGIEDAEAVKRNIGLLRNENTFTVCTAHQPNLLTGPLYFIYKIVHAIKLADTLKEHMPESDFVPVFFMGSEDADQAELNHFWVEGKKYEWQTNQTGAVGRMKVDKALLELIGSLEGRLLVEPFGNEIVSILKKCYKEGATIEQATFLLVHELFKQFGLVVLLPDNAALKREMATAFAEDIVGHTPQKIVEQSSEKLARHYHAQAFARPVNLFYMKDDLRSRIVPSGNRYIVHDTDIVFTREEILVELKQHPERFSPNVILRGLFQETILPNVAFIGGGGELAYWLQLKELFHHYQVTFPALVLRNSFLMIKKSEEALRQKLHLSLPSLFEPSDELLKQHILASSTRDLSTESEIQRIKATYQQLGQRAQEIDPTLTDHIAALETLHVKRLQQLSKKFLSAEKKKSAASLRQIQKLLDKLFPDSGLQERAENFSLGYAIWGPSLIDELYKTSPSMHASFTILIEKNTEPGRMSNDPANDAC